MCSSENPGRPEGEAGRNMLERMNSGAHAALSEWALSDFTAEKDSDILEIGCGGGANIARLLRLCPEGSVTGVDYSQISVEVSTEYNKKETEDGRCRILRENVTELSFEDETFDLATAFETVYFWPSIENAFMQVYRVLKSGGRFFICNETDGEAAEGYEWERNIEGLKIYKIDEIKRLLADSGFKGIEIKRNVEKGWITFTAYKQ